MKDLVKQVLQKILGFENYLLLFSIFALCKLRWDNREKEFVHFAKMLPDEGLVLDIGANVGTMSLHLSSNLPNAEIVAFEPISSNYRAFEKILSILGRKNIRVFETALGNTSGVVEMVLPLKNGVKFHGLCQVRGMANTSHEGEIHRVPMRRLDDFSEKVFRNTIRGVKIDVENFEFEVLKGGRNTISKHRPLVFCELWDNENREKCMEFFKSLAYDAFVLERGRLVPCRKRAHTTQNFFFLPEKNLD